MPATRAVRPVATPPARPGHPHVRITAGTTSVTIDYVSSNADEAGIAPAYTEVERPGRTPLLLRSGSALPRLSFDATFLRGNSRESVEARLTELRRLAASAVPVTIANYGASASGRWRLVDVTLTHDRRANGTNATIRATASLTFVRVSDPTVNVGPLSGGAKPPPGAKPPARGPASGRPVPRTHVIARGDQLYKLAQRYYGDGNRWRRIADANKLDPRRLPIGRRITIPA